MFIRILSPTSAESQTFLESSFSLMKLQFHLIMRRDLLLAVTWAEDLAVEA